MGQMGVWPDTPRGLMLARRSGSQYRKTEAGEEKRRCSRSMSEQRRRRRGARYFMPSPVVGGSSFVGVPSVLPVASGDLGAVTQK